MTAPHPPGSYYIHASDEKSTEKKTLTENFRLGPSAAGLVLKVGTVMILSYSMIG